MTVFLATLAVFGLALLAMSVGLLTGRVRMRGSCGGIAGQCDGGGEPVCHLCRLKPGGSGREG